VEKREAHDTGIEAYMYAYPLVTMELMRRVWAGAARQSRQGCGRPLRAGFAARIAGDDQIDLRGERAGGHMVTVGIA